MTSLGPATPDHHAADEQRDERATGQRDRLARLGEAIVRARHEERVLWVSGVPVGIELVRTVELLPAHISAIGKQERLRDEQVARSRREPFDVDRLRPQEDVLVDPLAAGQPERDHERRDDQ